MDCSESESFDGSSSRKRNCLEPALVRHQISEKRSNDLHSHRITKDLVKIGRGLHSDIQILNMNVSRLHSILQQNNGSGLWSLTNISKFDTYVNEICLQQYENRVVKFGDNIQFSQEQSCIYEFCLVEKKDGENPSPPIVESQDDIGGLINLGERALYSHQQHKQELLVESAELEDEYSALMNMSNELIKKKDLLTQQIQEITEKLMKNDDTIKRKLRVFQDIKLDHENISNSMRLQCELHIAEEEKLPSLKNNKEWEAMKTRFREEMDDSEIVLKNMVSMLNSEELSAK